MRRKWNRPALLLTVALALGCLLGGSVAWAQGAESRPQAEVASKIVKFAPLNRAAREYREAFSATDLGGARKHLGKPTTFKGTVVDVLTPEGNSAVILSFAADSKAALTVIVLRENFTRFPNLEDLKGKEVAFTSKVVENEGHLELVLTRPGQLKIVP